MCWRPEKKIQGMFLDKDGRLQGKHNLWSSTDGSPETRLPLVTGVASKLNYPQPPLPGRWTVRYKLNRNVVSGDHPQLPKVSQSGCESPNSKRRVRKPIRLSSSATREIQAPWKITINSVLQRRQHLNVLTYSYKRPNFPTRLVRSSRSPVWN